MNWSEPAPPKKEIPYDHVICNTPLGVAQIEWKGWKSYPYYSLSIGGEYIDGCDSLEEAKELAWQHLDKKRNELSVFLLQQDTK